ncbi:MAG: hypothetical protein M5U26_13560 [Planctomycetota bacterium]|nr:hypothetical protein [Planctomycetota bacterium]
MRFAILIPILASSVLAGATAGENADPVAPLPEGHTGIAAKFPGDLGIANDPAVLVHDDFESCSSPADLRKTWDRVHNDQHMRIAEEPENRHAGRRAVECSVPVRDSELSVAILKVFTEERDILFMRWYSKFDPNFDQVGSSHNGGHINAHYYNNGRATPGQRADGKNKFHVGLENWRGEEETQKPGFLNIYCYHPEMRSNFGDHFHSDGTVTPYNGGRNAIFGPQFVSRPKFIPELDRWYCYELMVKANTVGKRDGRIAFWADGKLTGDFPNLRLRDIDSLKIDGCGFGLHIGRSPRLNKKWYDDVVVATSYIGPMLKAPQAAVASKPAAVGSGASKPEAVVAAAPPKPAGPSPEQQAKAKERFGELKSAVIAQAGQGRREYVYVEVLGKVDKVQVVGADEKALVVNLQGNRFPLPWEGLPAAQFFSVAQAYSQDKVAIYEYCLGMGLPREAELALTRR